MRKRIEKWMNILINLYLVLLAAGLPLYMRNHYFDIGEAKWEFYQAFSYGFPLSRFWVPGILIILGILFAFLPEKEKKDNAFSVPDRFLMLYMLAVLISEMFSLDPFSSISGYDGWHMGLLAQFSFAMIYFFVSRFWKPNPCIFRIAESVSFLVFFQVIINRFWLYPFNTAGDVSSFQLYHYVSTIGNIDWYAGYFTAVFPIGLVFFLNGSASEKTYIFDACYIFAGSMSSVMADADSAVLGLASILLISFFLYVKNKAQAERYLEGLFLIFLSWGVSGILQTIFHWHVMALGFLSTLLTRTALPWILTSSSMILLAVLKKKLISAESLISWFRKAIGAILVLLAVYVILNSAGFLPDSLRIDNAYLLINDQWGHGRWTIFALTFSLLVSILQKAPLRILFGVGPDQLYKGFKTYAPEEYWTAWTGDPIQNAHNEPLNHLAVFGLAGMITYYGFLLSSVIRYSENHHSFCKIAVITGCAYMIHGLVSFQQVLSTPFIFAAIGMAEASLLRDPKEKARDHFKK